MGGNICHFCFFSGKIPELSGPSSIFKAELWNLGILSVWRSAGVRVCFVSPARPPQVVFLPLRLPAAINTFAIFPLTSALPTGLRSFPGLIFLALFPAVFRMTGSPSVNWMVS